MKPKFSMSIQYLLTLPFVARTSTAWMSKVEHKRGFFSVRIFVNCFRHLSVKKLSKLQPYFHKINWVWQRLNDYTLVTQSWYISHLNTLNIKKQECEHVCCNITLEVMIHSSQVQYDKELPKSVVENKSQYSNYSLSYTINILRCSNSILCSNDYTISSWDPFYWYGLTLFLIGITNCSHDKFWKWINNFIPHFTGHVVTHIYIIYIYIYDIEPGHHCFK